MIYTVPTSLSVKCPDRHRGNSRDFKKGEIDAKLD